jgi:hypothetical protein
MWTTLGCKIEDNSLIRFYFEYIPPNISGETDSVIWVDTSSGEDYEAARGQTETVTSTCIGNNAIGWSSCLQDVLAIPTTEAGYISVTCCAQEAAWLKAILKEFGQDTTPIMMTGNDGARKLSENPEFHRRTKHINIRYHYIRSQLSDGELKIDWTPGRKNKADLLTKSLAGPKLNEAIVAVLGKEIHQ